MPKSGLRLSPCELVVCCCGDPVDIRMLFRIRRVQLSLKIRCRPMIRMQLICVYGRRPGSIAKLDSEFTMGVRRSFKVFAAQRACDVHFRLRCQRGVSCDIPLDLGCMQCQIVLCSKFMLSLQHLVCFSCVPARKIDCMSSSGHSCTVGFCIEHVLACRHVADSHALMCIAKGCLQQTLFVGSVSLPEEMRAHGRFLSRHFGSD